MVDKRKDRRDERGVATVEMAFVLMILIMLVMGVADLGRALFTYIGVQDAAQEGALYASFEPTSESAIRTRVIDSIDYPALTAADVTVSCPDGSPTGGNTVSVEVTHTVNLVTPIVGAFFGGSLDLSREYTGEVFLGQCLTP